MPMALIKGSKGDFFCNDPDAVATVFTDLALTMDATRYLCYTSDATKMWWSNGDALTVQRNTGSGFTTVPAAEYVVEWLRGGVRFIAQQQVGATFRATGKYITPTQLAGCFQWKCSLNLADEDTSVFGDYWDKQDTIGGNATFEVQRFYQDEFFLDHLLLGNLIFVGYADSTSTPKKGLAAYVSLGGTDTEASRKAHIKETMKFKSQGAVYPIRL